MLSLEVVILIIKEKTWFVINFDELLEKMEFVQKFARALDPQETRIFFKGKKIFVNFHIADKNKKPVWSTLEVGTFDDLCFYFHTGTSVELQWAVAIKANIVKLPKKWTSVTKWYKYKYNSVILQKKGKEFKVVIVDACHSRTTVVPKMIIKQKVLGRGKQLANLRQFAPTTLSKKAQKSFKRAMGFYIASVGSPFSM